MDAVKTITQLVLTMTLAMINVPYAESSPAITAESSKPAPAAKQVSAKKVRAVKGNIVISHQGKDSRLTTSGLDSEPRLSPDGSQVAFVRAVRGKQVETAAGEVDASEIWIAASDGSEVHRLVTYSRDIVPPEETLADFANLRFSLDGETLYFASAGWATSGALKAVDLRTGTVRHISPANGFEILTRGKYKNHFVTGQHKYGPYGAEDKYWLLSPEGKELQEVGEDLAESVKRLEKK